MAPAVTAAPGVAVAPDYVIGSDDVLSVVFWRDKELTTDVTVRPDGNISIPLINEVHAAGLTPAQLKDRIAEESRKYIEDPTVTVVVKEIKSRRVFITGEVKKPGPYSLTGGMSVLQLISVAGGLADYAKPEKISIVRNEGGKAAEFQVQLQGSARGKEARTEHRAEARRHGHRSIAQRIEDARDFKSLRNSIGVRGRTGRYDCECRAQPSRCSHLPAATRFRGCSKAAPRINLIDLI